MDLAISIIVALAATAAAVAALGSWKAATKANETAATIAAIERDRRHTELTPEFGITFEVRSTAPGSADMHIMLTGGIDRLDAVTVTILDDAVQDRWSGGLPAGVTQEEAEAFVWGPWEFNTGASKQVVSSRETRPRAYDRVSGKNWDLLSMHPTRPGRWMSMGQDDWHRQCGDQPVRLLITCQREGYEPWTLQRDVKVQPSSPFVA